MTHPPRHPQCLAARLAIAPPAAAAIESIHADAARAAAGVRLVLLAGDLGRANRFDPQDPDEPLLAEGQIEFHGQPVALVVADSAEAAETGAALVETRCHPIPPVLGVDHALAMQSFHGEAVVISRGDAGAALAKAPHLIEGTLEIGGQLPFPARPLRAIAEPRDDGTLGIEVRAELPAQVRAAVAAALHEPESSVEIHAEPIGDFGGGRQREATRAAVLAALAARRVGRPVCLTLPRALDLALTAKRHATRANFRAGFDGEGHLLAADLSLWLDGGHRAGDSVAALDLALLHADGAYFAPDFRVTGRLCRTHVVTGAALPAEGAAQGAMAMEEILSRAAHRLGLPIERIREINLYSEAGHRHSTPYGQPVDCGPLAQAWQELTLRSDFTARREAIEQWNAANPCMKRGLAIVPAKFGLGDPRAERNQAAALVQLFGDGSIAVSLGCAEAGDGLDRLVAEETAAQFGLAAGRVRVRCGLTNEVALSTSRIGCDSAGLAIRAVAEACETLKTRLRPVAAQLLAPSRGGEIDPESVRFEGGEVVSGQRGGGTTLSFAELIDSARQRRIPLAATGFHRTPNLWWDRELGAGWPFSGYVCAAAALEVQLDGFTGEIRVLRADVIHPGGSAAGAAQERAQIARSLQMGLGWMLSESVTWSADGRLRQDSAAHYFIPGPADAPPELTIDLLSAPRHPAAHAAASGAACAVFLAAAAREAAREAIRAFGTPADPSIEVDLPAPATPSATLEALRDLSRRLAAPPSTQ